MKRVVNCPSCGKPADYNTEHQVLEQETENDIDGSVTRYYSIRHECGHTFADTVHTPPSFPTFYSPNLGVKQFETGALRGSDEIRYDLVPKEMIVRAVEAFTEGAAKYGERNYQKGIPIQNLLNHAIHHLFSYGDGKEDHIAHALANLGMICWMEVNKPNDVS